MILFINPKIRDMVGEAHPPLSFAYLVGALLKNGYDYKDIKIIDLQAGEKLDSRLIKEAKAICLTSMSFGFFRVIDFIKSIKPSTNAPVILGGAHASMVGSSLIKHYPFIDFIIKGEGEHSLPQLLKGDAMEGIPGLIYRKDGRVLENKVHIEENIDQLPFPDYHLFKAKYISFPNSSQIFSSRGCPLPCIFCETGNVMGKKFRFHSAERAVSEIENRIEQFGSKTIQFTDDNFVVNNERAVKIAEMIIKKNLDIKLEMGISVNKTDPGMLKLLHSAGLSVVSFGIESTDLEVQKLSKKIINIKKVKELVQTAKNLGIHTRGLFIIGLPGDTYQKSTKSINDAVSFGFDSIGVGIATPYPGTPLWEWSKKFAHFTTDGMDIGKYLDNNSLSPEYGNIPFETDEFTKAEREAAYKYAIKVRNKLESMGLKLFKKVLLRVLKGRIKLHDVLSGSQLIWKYVRTGYF